MKQDDISLSTIWFLSLKVHVCMNNYVLAGTVYRAKIIGHQALSFTSKVDVISSISSISLYF